jgi:hypothetical protein
MESPWSRPLCSVREHQARQECHPARRRKRPGAPTGQACRHVPDQTANHGDSRSLTDNETHHLTCVCAAQPIRTRCLPSWSCGFDSRRPLLLIRAVFRILSSSPRRRRARCPPDLPAWAQVRALGAGTFQAVMQRQAGRVPPPDAVLPHADRARSRCRSQSAC